MNMKRFALVALACAVLALTLATTGCRSSRRKEAKAILRGQAQLAAQQRQLMIKQLEAQGDSVTVLGEVRNVRVTWTEELTLTQALVAADYVGRREPVSIWVNRQGRSYFVDPKRLLKGREDPPLEPGDIIHIR